MKRRNLFSLSHFKLLTGKMGYLYPISCLETLPGDTFQMATSVFLRFSPMVAPVMTPVTVKIHHWFVPLRLLWDEWEDFITGGPDGLSVPEMPWCAMANSQRQGLEDYFGIPPQPDDTYSPHFSSLPFRAYNLIWNEWYRDQNLQDPLPFSTASGQDFAEGTPRMIQRSAWDKDYFTTATPWEQKGLAVNVPVMGTPSGTLSISGNGAPTFKVGNHSGPIYGVAAYEPAGEGSSASLTGRMEWRPTGPDSDSFGNMQWDNPALKASFTGDSSLGQINLNQFREAMAMQRFEEHRALYGSRYVEYLRYLGVKASDARLQRPEYLGGGRSVIQFSEVLQTAQDGDTPVGTMRGHGIGAMRTNRFRRFFEEHGFVISLLSIRPKSIYMQAVPKMFYRQFKTDYWQKELEHIGQEPIKTKDIYVGATNPEEIFGYSDRYNEYRSQWSSVHGEFRELLNYWHLGRDFESKPTLNSDFISSLPSDRIFADQTGNDTIYMMVNNSVQARRLVSKRGNPI